MSSTEKLVIKTINRPEKKGEAALLEWFCDVFDLAGKKNDLEPEILKEIAGKSMAGIGVTSKELNMRLDTPRSTVIYHLNRFIYSGLIIRKGRKYYLRSNDMTSTMEELQSEMLREFNRLIEFAGQLDKIMENDLYARRRKQERKER